MHSHRSRHHRRVSRGDRGVRGLVLPQPERREGLLRRRPERPLVGDHGLDRRDRDEHGDVHQRAGRRLHGQLDVPAARDGLHGGPHRREHHLRPGVLPRRAADRLPDPGRAIRRRREAPGGWPVPGDAQPRRRGAAVRDGPGAGGAAAGDARHGRLRPRVGARTRSGGHGDGGVGARDGAHDDRLHLPRRHERGHLDGRDPAGDLPDRRRPGRGHPHRP